MTLDAILFGVVIGAPIAILSALALRGVIARRRPAKSDAYDGTWPEYRPRERRDV